MYDKTHYNKKKKKKRKKNNKWAAWNWLWWENLLYENGQNLQTEILSICLYDPVTKYLPAHHNHPQLTKAEAVTQRS